MPRRLLEALKSGRVLLMDGAMGTELQRVGLTSTECPEAWNFTHPDRVRAIHQAYVDGGAEVLVTNTFQANPRRLGSFPKAPATADAVAEGLRLAHCCCESRHFVLLGIGPFQAPGSSMLDPLTIASFGAAPRCADGLLFETWSDVACLELAKDFRRWDPALATCPMFLSLAFQRDSPSSYRTIGGGQSPEWFASRAEDHGFAGLGINCGKDLSLADVAAIVRRFRRETDLPIFARPNAGTPTRLNDQWVYPGTPEAMATGLTQVLEAGAVVIGGCCGTTPAHIRAFAAVVNAWNDSRPKES